jgi:hypothetical protein
VVPSIKLHRGDEYSKKSAKSCMIAGYVIFIVLVKPVNMELLQFISLLLIVIGVSFCCLLWKHGAHVIYNFVFVHL